MRQITVVNNVTLDGVMQGPARPDEDTRGGFVHGGWALPYDDAVKAEFVAKRMAGGPGALLLGRRTYLDFHDVWAGRTGNPFSESLDRQQKFVVSNTLSEPLPWPNSTRLGGDPAAAVAQLKDCPGDDLTVLGSGELIRALLPERLVDVFLLFIHPLVLGRGRQLFDGAAPTSMHVADTVTTTTGVIIATYQAG